jgi:hypothetical protein
LSLMVIFPSMFRNTHITVNGYQIIGASKKLWEICKLIKV